MCVVLLEKMRSFSQHFEDGGGRGGSGEDKSGSGRPNCALHIGEEREESSQFLPQCSGSVLGSTRPTHST